MASWFSHSLSNLFDKGYIEDDDDDDEEEDEHQPEQNPSPPSVNDTDFSAVIGRQLRGVAAFLAPPPSTSDAAGVSSATQDTSTDTISGIKNDLVEIGGSFKSKLSLLSSNKAVTEISRFATNFLQFGDGEDEKVEAEALGITEKVVNFVQDISERPELWTDFPSILNHDFDMSDIQREHVAAIEDTVPRIAALRHEIRNYVNKDFFWMIYFILLLPRLNENEAKLLSTPEIVEARDILLQKLQKRNMAPAGNSEVFESVRPNEDLAKVVNTGSKINYSENTKKFEEKDVGTYQSIDEVKLSEEDVSFSDLQIDDNYISGKQPGFRQSEISSCSESGDWVELNGNLGLQGDKQKTVPSTFREKGSESEESNEWLTIDDSDLDRPAVG